MALAAIGLLLSIGAHIASLLGLPLPGDKLVWSLHVGIFVVWLPAVLVATRANRGRPQSEFWKNVLSGCPPWMRNAGYALLAYAIANFIGFMVTTGSEPQPEGNAPPSVVRGFSGHWLIFYGAAFAIFFSAYRNPRLLKKQKCSNGHDVSAADIFCPTCGSKIQASRLGA
jgi:hypothetical protein